MKYIIHVFIKKYLLKAGKNIFLEIFFLFIFEVYLSRIQITCILTSRLFNINWVFSFLSFMLVFLWNQIMVVLLAFVQLTF